MDLNEAPENQRLRLLWAAHLAEPFPSEVGKSDDAGADLVTLDADIAGVISTVLGSRRPPDGAQQQTLRACVEELDRLEVVEVAQPYFTRLRELAILALGAAGHRG